MGVTDIELKYLDKQEDGTISLKDKDIFKEYFFEIKDEEKDIIKTLCKQGYNLIEEYNECLAGLPDVLNGAIDRYNQNITKGTTGLVVVDKLQLKILEIQERRKKLNECITLAQMEIERLKRRYAAAKDYKVKLLITKKIKALEKVVKELKTQALAIKRELQKSKEVLGYLFGAQSTKTMANNIHHLCIVLGNVQLAFARIKKKILNGMADSGEVKQLIKAIKISMKSGKMAQRISALKDGDGAVVKSAVFSEEINTELLELAKNTFTEIKGSMTGFLGQSQLGIMAKKVKAVAGGIVTIRNKMLKKAKKILEKHGIDNSEILAAVRYAMKVWVYGDIIQDQNLYNDILSWSKKVAVGGAVVMVCGITMVMFSMFFLLPAATSSFAVVWAVYVGGLALQSTGQLVAEAAGAVALGDAIVGGVRVEGIKPKDMANIKPGNEKQGNNNEPKAEEEVKTYPEVPPITPNSAPDENPYANLEPEEDDSAIKEEKSKPKKEEPDSEKLETKEEKSSGIKEEKETDSEKLETKEEKSSGTKEEKETAQDKLEQEEDKK